MVTQVASTGWGPSGLLGAFMMTAGQGGPVRSVVFYIIALIISYIGGFVMTNIFYHSDELNYEITLPENMLLKDALSHYTVVQSSARNESLFPRPA